MSILKVKRIRENATVPKRQTDGSAGYDLSACINGDIAIPVGEIRAIPTGISVEFGNNYALMIYARSGLASKYGITLANCVGVVDSDYRGEIKVPLINLGQEEFVVTEGMRIAQMVLTPIATPKLEIVEELGETERGAGGFGSTGQG